MVRAKRRGSSFHCTPSGCGGNGAIAVKPIGLGLLVAAVTAFAFIMIFSLVFVLMKAIITSAILPLSLIALMAGCFVGGLICGTIARSRGLLYGLAIGGTVFLIVWLISTAMGEEPFCLLALVKLVCLLLAGGCGGWLGSNQAHTRRGVR